MPVFKDYSRQGKLLGTRDEPLNENNFERYLNEFGEGEAKGYLKALIDAVKELEEIVSPKAKLTDATPTQVYNGVKKFLKDKHDLLNSDTQIKSIKNSIDLQ